MKLELLLAVILLAAGSLLWNVRNPASKTDLQPQSATLAPSSNGLKSSPADPAGAQIIRQSAENLLNSVPIEAKANITINLFDQSLEATGRYYQQGQGTRRARLEFSLPGEKETTHITQLCDGRFHYSMQTTGNQKRLEFVDLEKISQANNGENSLGRPLGGMYFSGSISSLMNNLANAFDFETPTQTQLGGISMVSIKGKWKPQVLKRLVGDLVDSKYLEPEIKWSELPPQIPHTVEVTLGNDQFLPLFPYRIAFYQFDSATSGIASKVLQLELYEVGKLRQLPDTIFNIDSANAESIDSTEKYVYRMQHYKSMMNSKPQQAAISSDSTKR